ncbi:DsbA family protein [Alkalibacterium sp. f15]|uniref:DsbA family protein n=1 Tax=Alkalibacterium sp. f15 TaxID=3414029 RepID=UPI003BF83097
MFLNNIIEVFLFVNPLGPTCLETEKMIESFSNERDEKVKVRFIPLLNFHTIGNIVKESDNPTLAHRNQLYTESFYASLAFQAASMQGKKKGRKFLMALQDKVNNEGKEVTKELFTQIAESIKLDIEMFEEDIQSDFSKLAFKKDQNLAQEMKIQNAPSCILYSGNNDDYGYRVDTAFTKQLLHGFCDEKVQVKKASVNRLSLLQMM